jgi:cytochrome c oxidase assembly protein subunit 15
VLGHRVHLSADRSGRKQVAAWLLVCCAVVFAVVVVGGVTRLTGSGLSIVEWQPIVGMFPPLTDAQWDEVFYKYRETPQYQKVNLGMSLGEFKRIFWWEYFHRLLGRALGLVFFLPLLYFSLSRRIGSGLALRLFGIFLLGALQGALGWYMVKSGLVDDPRVSQYRLSAHLGLAFLIFAALFWTALSVLTPQRNPPDPARRRLFRFAASLSAVIFLMALSGGLVAGMHAGLVYNTFPLMNGHLVPMDYLALQPWHHNLFDNVAAVQFDHRLIAWLLAILVPLFWLRSRSLQLEQGTRFACNLLLLVLALQIGLGISTLLMMVPVPLAAAHQAGALTLFATSLWACHGLR